MTKDYRTADAIERELTLAGVLHDKARWWIPGTSREGPMPCARDTGALCRYYSAGRPCPHGDRCPHTDDSRPGERVPAAARPSPPARLGQRPTRRHLVAATESTRRAAATGRVGAGGARSERRLYQRAHICAGASERCPGL